jgi:hypothetical protein
MIKISKSYKSKSKMDCSLIFQITQHIRDIKLMKSLEKYFHCGKCNIRRMSEISDYNVMSFQNISEIIIPFFDAYPLRGVKSKNLVDFRKAAEIMKVKGHLENKGLEQLLILKAGMNRGRTQ